MHFVSCELIAKPKKCVSCDYLDVDNMTILLPS
jgi:hypothetical protein